MNVNLGLWLKIKKRRSGFRLTIRNVNGINPDAGGQLATSFRLTIRNVNVIKKEFLSQKDYRFRLTIRNVNLGLVLCLLAENGVLD